jgi:gamma-glutamyltranspeptidase/glutathione hydrolase
MTIEMADGRKTFIDFREKAPLAATPDMYLDSAGQRHQEREHPRASRRSVCRAASQGLEYAREKYGTRARGTLIAPAIAFAERGFVLDEGDIALLATATDDFRADSATAAIFLNKGQPYKVGDRLVQKDLAHTLRLIAQRGPDGFYRGFVADAIAASSAVGNGIITKEDLAQYRVRELAPIECDYRGYHVVSAPPPSSGGVVVCEFLNISRLIRSRTSASAPRRRCTTRSKRCGTRMSIATAISAIPTS